MSNEFDPNWPHGHVMKCYDNTLSAGRLIAADLPDDMPFAFYRDDDKKVWRFDAQGYAAPGTFRLINAPAPVKHAEAWFNVWQRKDGSCYYGSRHDGGSEGLEDAQEAARLYATFSAAYIGAQRWSTDGTGGDIIGPNGEVVKL